MGERPPTVVPLRALLNWVGVLAAALGVVGWIRAPQLALLWAFLIAFGLAPVPRALWRELRAPRR